MDIVRLFRFNLLYNTLLTLTLLISISVQAQPLHNDSAAICIRQLWKSPPFDFNIHGIAVGDVDNDGKTDILLLTEKNILRYHYENGAMHGGAEIYKIRMMFPVAIDIADINRNGFPELFVTAFDINKKSIVSFVTEYNGKEFITVTRSFPWYLRVVTPGNGMPVLFGQKYRRNTLFIGEQCVMAWSGDTAGASQRSRDRADGKKAKAIRFAAGAYIPCRTIDAPLFMNILGTAYGDILNTGQPCLAAYTPSNTIVVLGADNKKIWESSEKFGGSNFYHQHEGKSPATEGPREYLPLRLLIEDVNGNGRNELIVIKNYEITGTLFDKFRIYKEHRIETFAWDGFSLHSRCHTGTIYGFVRDFVIADLDNDGKKELITVSVIKESKPFSKKAEIYLVMYRID